MKKKYIILFLIVFLLTFIFGFFFYSIYIDEVWNYGFAYSISKGLIPYKDFNMIITPLYPFLLSFFINLFGNYLYSMYIFNSLIASLIFIIMFKKIKYKSLIIYPLVLFIIGLGYNLFAIFLALLIVMLCKYKYKYTNVILGILVSFLFLTKQNIGFVFLIPLFFYSKSFKDFILRLFSFSVPILLFLVYLEFNGALYNFIDYCFLGLFDFASKNIMYFLIWLWLPIVFYLIYKLFKSKFIDEECMYVLCFQMMAYPLFDIFHFNISFILFIFYFLGKVNLNKFKQSIYVILSFLFLICLTIFSFNGFVYGSRKSSFLYMRLLGNNVENGILELEDYVYSNLYLFDNDFDNFYIFDDLSYLIKLDMNLQIGKYDLINNGNMGYRGENNIIEKLEEKCSNNSCMFVLPKNEVDNQINKSILKYVKDNYIKINNINIFDIYVSGDYYE